MEISLTFSSFSLSYNSRIGNEFFFAIPWSNSIAFLLLGYNVIRLEVCIHTSTNNWRYELAEGWVLFPRGPVKATEVATGMIPD